MRLYFRPPRSPVGVSTGLIGGLIVWGFYCLLGLFYAFFIWPFQLIWLGLPREFPRNRNLVAWQVGLSCAYIGLLAVLIAVGSSQGGSADQETNAPLTTQVITQVTTTATAHQAQRPVQLVCDNESSPTKSAYGYLTCADGYGPFCPNGDGVTFKQRADGEALYYCSDRLVYK